MRMKIALEGGIIQHSYESLPCFDPYLPPHAPRPYIAFTCIEANLWSLRVAIVFVFPICRKTTNRLAMIPHNRDDYDPTMRDCECDVDTHGVRILGVRNTAVVGLSPKKLSAILLYSPVPLPQVLFLMTS